MKTNIEKNVRVGQALRLRPLLEGDCAGKKMSEPCTNFQSILAFRLNTKTKIAQYRLLENFCYRKSLSRIILRTCDCQRCVHIFFFFSLDFCLRTFENLCLSAVCPYLFSILFFLDFCLRILFSICAYQRCFAGSTQQTMLKSQCPGTFKLLYKATIKRFVQGGKCERDEKKICEFTITPLPRELFRSCTRTNVADKCLYQGGHVFRVENGAAAQGEVGLCVVF